MRTESKVRVRRVRQEIEYAGVNEWLERSKTVIALLQETIAIEVRDVCQRSCFSSILQWTEYDQMMFGHMDFTSFQQKSLGVVMLLTKGRDSLWCRGLCEKLVLSLRRALTLTKSENSHYCRPERECWCVKSIIRRMTFAVLDLLFSVDHGVVLELFRLCFVRVSLTSLCPAPSYTYIPAQEWRRIWTAVAMSQHSRLGRESLMSMLNSDVLACIYATAFSDS